MYDENQLLWQSLPNRYVKLTMLIAFPFFFSWMCAQVKQVSDMTFQHLSINKLKFFLSIAQNEKAKGKKKCKHILTFRK